MKNLNPYTKNTFQFHKDVVKSTKSKKDDIAYKTRLLDLEVNIEILYSNFLDNHNVNNLISTLAHNYLGSEKDDLLSLYSYKRAIIQKLKNEVTTTETGRLISTCQNCTVNKINSFDHILPKEEFSEFAVNPLNLFPSCSECNSYKGVYWQMGGVPYFLNLYLDILPNLQYLFVDVDLTAQVPKIKFYLDDINGIDPRLFSITKTHYSRLHLFDRFSDSIDDVITPLVNEVKAGIDEFLDYPTIQRIVIRTQTQNQLKFGFNYWKAILALALINHPDFFDFVQNNG